MESRFSCKHIAAAVAAAAGLPLDRARAQDVAAPPASAAPALDEMLSPRGLVERHNAQVVRAFELARRHTAQLKESLHPPAGAGRLAPADCVDANRIVLDGGFIEHKDIPAPDGTLPSFQQCVAGVFGKLFSRAALDRPALATAGGRPLATDAGDTAAGTVSPAR